MTLEELKELRAKMRDVSHSGCPICREDHDPDRGLVFDGHGVNSCDAYRTRIATLTDDYRIMRGLGDVFALAPALLGALIECKEALEHAARSEHHPACKCRGEYSVFPERHCTCHVQKARAALGDA